MLLGDDVLDVKRQKIGVVLVKLTVFKATACPFPRERSQCGTHHPPDEAARFWRALDFRTATNVPKETYVPYSAFSSGVSDP
jgi:hypothetical protein